MTLRSWFYATWGIAARLSSAASEVVCNVRQSSVCGRAPDLQTLRRLGLRSLLALVAVDDALVSDLVEPDE